MEFVDPIRDVKKIDAMKRHLKKKNLRDYVLFTLGINSGLRISDLLSLQIEDVKDKDRIVLREGKTKKGKNFPLSDNCKTVLAEYLNATGVTKGPLFPSRKGNEAIKRVQAYKILNAAAANVGIKDTIGTHSLRKTFAYHAYKNGYDISLLQKLLNHSSPAVTLRYMGITQDQMDEVYINLNL